MPCLAKNLAETKASIDSDVEKTLRTSCTLFTGLQRGTHASIEYKTLHYKNCCKWMTKRNVGKIVSCMADLRGNARYTTQLH